MAEVKQFDIVADDGMTLKCALFSVSEPKAVVQLIHGAKEYKERYYPFCEFLQQNGYAVVLSDNRGHGQSVDDAYPLGHFDSAYRIVQDQSRISEYAQSLYPDVPLYLFGHSLGSCIARALLQQGDNRYAKLAMTGTVFYVPFAKSAVRFFKKHCRVQKAERRDTLLVKIGDNRFNGWVVRDKEMLRRYRADSMCCGYRYTQAAVLGVMEADSFVGNQYQSANPQLQIASFAGKGDPITGFGWGLRRSIRRLKKAGYVSVQSKRYAGMRHEVLNESQHRIVYNDILAFYNR